MTTTTANRGSRIATLLGRWPTALGLLVAGAALATGPDREGVGITVSVAALCYVAAAALNRRWIAWASIVGGTLVVVAGELVGLTWWAAIAAAGMALVGIGLLGQASRRTLIEQAAALVVFGALAIVALVIAPRVGAVLAGVALAGHAGWDVLHYRRNAVVPRSMAEFCMFLDVPLGLGLVAVSLSG